MKFKAQVSFDGERTLVVMNGWLDERAELPELEQPVGGDLIIDLEKVTMVNSMGVRNWIQWQSAVEVEKNVMLINCSPVVVKQINILDGFLNDRTKIESIFVPYFCEDCGFEENKLIKIAQIKSPDEAAEAFGTYKCPKCAMNMELDMVKSQYFAFLEKQRAKFT